MNPLSVTATLTQLTNLGVIFSSTSAETIVEHLRTWVRLNSQVIMQNGGSVCETAGDYILAACLSTGDGEPTHAYRAAGAQIDRLRELEASGATWRPENAPVQITICRGQAVWQRTEDGVQMFPGELRSRIDVLARFGLEASSREDRRIVVDDSVLTACSELVVRILGSAPFRGEHLRAYEVDIDAAKK